MKIILSPEEAPRSPEPSPLVSTRHGFGRMAGIISKLKCGVSSSTPPPLESNPIMQYFEVGKESSTAGPGLVWRIHDAYRKSDGKVSTYFLSHDIPTSLVLSSFIGDGNKLVCLYLTSLL